MSDSNQENELRHKIIQAMEDNLRFEFREFFQLLSPELRDLPESQYRIQNALNNVHGWSLTKLNRLYKFLFSYCYEKAHLGDPFFQAFLCLAFIGTHMPEKKNPQLFFEWAQKSADQKNALGLNNLGYAYLFGVGVAKDPKKAFHLFEEAISRSSLCHSATNNLAFCYQHGLGVAADPKKSAELYSQILKYIPTAVSNLGSLYTSGSGVPKSPEKAFELYTKAAMDNNPYAMSNLADCYSAGLGTQIDHDLAIQWYLKAALANHPRAISKLKQFGKESLLEQQLSERANQIFEQEENNQRVLLLLLCVREKDSQSPFFKDHLPLDLFKHILSIVEVGRLPKRE